MAPKKTNDEIDSTSFSSILAGVKRMREQYGPNENQQQQLQTAPEELSAMRSKTARSGQSQNYSKALEALEDSRDSRKLSEAPEAPEALERSESTKTSKESESTKSTKSRESRNSIGQSAQADSGHKAPLIKKPRSGRPGLSGPVQSYTAIQVSNSQKGNPLLTTSLMKTTPWSFNGSVVSDYYINAKLQILFLSLKYHKLHPEYIWQRLKKMNRGSSLVNTGNDGVLRVLLVVVDIESHQEILRGVVNFCLKHDLSLVLAWSFEEAGNYICFFKQYEDSARKIDSAIKGVKSGGYQSCVVDALTSVRAVNKTDSIKLLAHCGSFKEIVLQSGKKREDRVQLNKIQGLGAKKLENLSHAFSEPFIYNKVYD